MGITIQNLIVERSRAINDLSLDIKPKGCFAILGPNGAGKTTIVNVICGLLESDKGSVKIFEMDPLKDAKEIRKIIGLVTQETALYEYLTGKENLEFHANFYGVQKDLVAKKVNEALKLSGLEGRANDKVSKYSGGMKRRLALVRALIHDPKIIILDEPTLGVDVQSRNQIWNHILELKKEKMVILNTNYMDEADRLSDECAIIDNGKLVTIGTPEKLKRTHAGGTRLEALLELQSNDLEELKKQFHKLINSDKFTIAKANDQNIESAKLYKIMIPSQMPSNELLTEFSKIVQECPTIKIVDLVIKVPSLDDVFLTLTGKSLIEEGI